MEGEGSGSPNKVHEPSEASTGNNTSSDRPGVYIRDDGSEISVSKNLVDWGVTKDYNFSPKAHAYSNSCYQMANLLEYQSRVYGDKYVDLYFDNNLVKKENALGFFEAFARKHDIQTEHPTSTKILNTVELRNLFRQQGNLHNLFEDT